MSFNYQQYQYVDYLIVDMLNTMQTFSFLYVYLGSCTFLHMFLDVCTVNLFIV